MAIEFYFSDLTPEAQQRFLKAQGLSCAEDGNYDMDILPIFILETDDEEDMIFAYMLNSVEMIVAKNTESIRK